MKEYYLRIDLVQYLTQGIAVCSDKSCVQVSAKEYAIYRLKNFVQILKNVNEGKKF